MPQRHRGKLIGLLCLGLIVLGFVLIKAPTPIISIAAEPIIDGGYTITNTMISAWVVIVLLALIVFWLYFTKLRNIEKAMVPSGFQNVIESLLDAFFGIVKLVAGETNGRRFFPVVASIFLILLFANWFGLFPWNNSFGRTVDLRFEYIELLEIDVEHNLERPRTRRGSRRRVEQPRCSTRTSAPTTLTPSPSRRPTWTRPTNASAPSCAMN